MTRYAAWILVLCSAVAGAATAFEGRVVTPGGTPVAGAQITVIGRPGTILADGDGRFSVTPDPVPPFILLVARADGVAYRPITVGALPAAGALELTVRPLGDTVTVVSGPPPDLEVPPASAATVMSSADLAQRAPAHVSEAIENIPGASASGVGPAAVPALRGLPKGRTLILLDGGRVTTERRAGASATFLDPESIDELEVVRGPGSVAYGSDAFGGVIRARSRMPDPGGRPSARAGLSGATATREWGAWAEASTSALGGGILVAAHARAGRDFSSPQGTVFNSAFETKGFRIGFQREVGGGILHVGWRTDLGRAVGKPAPDSRAKRTYYPEEDSHRFSLGFERPLTGAWRRLSVSAAWDSYRLVLDKDTPGTGAPSSRSEADTDARDYTLRLEAERSVAGLRLVVGANAYGRYGLRAVNRSFTAAADGSLLPTSSVVLVHSAHSDDAGVFAGLSGKAGPLRLSGGLRVDSVQSANTGGFFGRRSSSDTAVSGFAAATLPLGGGLEATVQGASGFRDARLSDRYYSGETGRGFITGNPDLKAERSRQLDLAVRWRRGTTQLAAYGYLYRIDDLIERYKSGGDYFFRNRGEAELKGIEVEGTVGLVPRLVLQVGAWAERGEVRGPGDPVDDIPAPGAFAVLRHRTQSGAWWLLRAAAFAAKTRPGPSERTVPGYAVIDVGAGWPLGQQLDLRIMARNLLDRRYLGSTDEDAVPAPGRSLQLTLRAIMGGPE